ncbi:Flagellar protein FliO [Variovorax sp. PBS-H4]|uniref:flagellar biosynthetic protein FliO n=1 Tax=Variovorax sp. PBS-H4 TaxID=434008 RepID=UPI0013186DC8|nr:flagellar biosynthetic protein FliO [Variovorax sp. PBS-H4]VTU26845.1 Flagellar protein FliO [Variovorax sp. PBS-H4]
MNLTGSFARWATALAACAATLRAHAALPTVPAPAAEAAPALGASGLLQAGLGMVLVLGLIFLCAWLARRFGLPRFGGSAPVKVVGSTMVGQRERVVLVEVGDTWLVLGVTASQVNALHSLPAQPLPAASAPLAAQGGSAKAMDLFAQKLRDSLGIQPKPGA